jgi:hypothetical protein
VPVVVLSASAMRSLVRGLAVALPVSFLAFATLADDDPGGRAKAIVAELGSARAVAVSASVQAATSASAAPSASASASASAEPARAPAAFAGDEAIAEARKALERAEQMRAVGDVTHARMAEELALEWAETARDAIRATESEREADRVATAAVKASSRAERARILLEEAIVRRGRLQTTLDALDAELAARPLASAKATGKPAAKGAKGGAK